MTAALGPAAARTRHAVAVGWCEARAAWSRAATGVVIGVGLAAAVPLIAVEDVPVERVVPAVHLAVAAVGLAIAIGLAGMPSLAGGAFMAVGAAAAALLRGRAGWPLAGAALAGVAAAALLGVVVGLAVVRLPAVLLAVSTWLLTFLVMAALTSFPGLLGGAGGIVLPARALTATAHYEAALAALVTVMAGFTVVARSDLGRELAATRKHTAAASALGVAVARRRIGCFAASAAVAGLAGALAVDFDRVADAGSFGPLLSFNLLVAVLLGGATVAAGPPAGVLLLAAFAAVAGVGGLEGLQANRVQTSLVALAVVVLLPMGDRGLVSWLLAMRRAATAGEPAAPRPGSDVGGAASCRATDIRAAVTAARGAPGVLDLRAVGKRLGSRPALMGVSLTVSGGTIHALIGPNGSGKTTLLRILSGRLSPDDGAVALDGSLLRGSQRDRALRGVVSTLQETAVFSGLTALEHALVGAGLRRRYGGTFRTLIATPKHRAERSVVRAHAEQALAVVGLAAVAERRVETLSGWQQRLVMIAAALATSPRVLALDEPAAGAAPAEIEQLAKILGDLRASGIALLLVEHNLALVNLVADRVSVLEGGRVIASGSPQEIGRSEAAVAAYLGRRGR